MEVFFFQYSSSFPFSYVEQWCSLLSLLSETRLSLPLLLLLLLLLLLPTSSFLLAYLIIDFTNFTLC